MTQATLSAAFPDLAPKIPPPALCTANYDYDDDDTTPCSLLPRSASWISRQLLFFFSVSSFLPPPVFPLPRSHSRVLIFASFAICVHLVHRTTFFPFVSLFLPPSLSSPDSSHLVVFTPPLSALKNRYTSCGRSLPVFIYKRPTLRISPPNLTAAHQDLEL